MRKWILAALFVFFGAPDSMADQMGNYCSAPPYVSRTIAPNVMILMDNSDDMWKPAYTDTYHSEYISDPNRQYIGYFNPEGCYKYDSNEFQEVLKLEGGKYRSYKSTEACPSDNSGYIPNKNWSSFTASSGLFRGHLLNWATMSKFDVLQKVLIGGNSASKQDNAHSLVSISGDWTVAGVKDNNTYQNCVFQVKSGNLTVSDKSSTELCTLLDDPASPIAWWRSPWFTRLIAKVIGTFKNLYASFTEGLQAFFASASRLWEQATLIANAWAAAACDNIATDELTLNGTVNSSYSLILKGSGCNNCSFTWTLTTKPSWIASASPSCSETTTKKTCGRATWTGTPTAVGDYAFTASMTSDGCTGTKTYSGTIRITAAVLKINTVSINDGNVGVAYSFTMSGQGGVTPYTWSKLSGSLPDGLSLSSGGVISGTPTTAGTYSFTIQLADSYAGNDPEPQGTYSITITAPALTISSTSPLPSAVADTGKSLDYQYQLTGTGGSGTYSWSLTSGSDNIIPAGGGTSGMWICTGSSNCVNPHGFTGTFAPGEIYGDTPNENNTYTFTVRLQDGIGGSVTKTFTLNTVQTAGALTISTSSLPDAVKGQAYSFTMSGTGGTASSYSWSWSGNPACLSMSTAGVISGTCAQSDVGTYNVTITLTDGTSTVTKSLTIKVVKTATVRSSSYNVKVAMMEEPFTDVNGNDIYDGSPETFASADDKDGDGVWDGKKGVFQEFWDATNPRARWGLTDFTNQGVQIEACIPASPASSFYTRIQNATPTTTADINAGLYGIINYFGNATSHFSQYDSTSYRGCNNSDPMDSVTCRKNFTLIITSGSKVDGTKTFATNPSECTSATSALQKNACFGYRTDLRIDLSQSQIMYTYVVDINQTPNTVLQNTATAGGGKYYSPSGTDLATALRNAFRDILAQAASGTAVSVLTTSSRGVGSVVQAYFLPVTKEGTREVNWTGYMKNLWIDYQDNLREDTYHDYKLITDSAGDSQGDKVMKLYFNELENEAEVALFTTDSTGGGGTLATCSPNSSDKKSFADVVPLWEAGTKLAFQDYDDRTIYTSNKVIRGEDSTTTLPKSLGDLAPKFTTTMDDTLKTVLNVESALGTATNDMIEYVQGRDLESSNTSYRDRRITVKDPDTNLSSLQVWKLGDVITSTPRVFASSRINVYDTHYHDGTYDTYLTLDNYQKKAAIAFVGANDGMLHAFNVGYIKQALSDRIKAIFHGRASDVDFDTPQHTTELGTEKWAYIPYNAFPYLKYLAATDYCHIYFNDMPVYLVDASIGAPDDDEFSPTAQKVCSSSTNCTWRTILIGGMRFGGACGGEGGLPANPPYRYGTSTPLSNVGYSAFYAIDITDRDNPIPLWEFSEADMGAATTFPGIIRTGDGDHNGHWYVVFGSGSRQLPLSSPVTRDIGKNDPGYIYILDMKTGEQVHKIGLGYNAIVGDITAIDADRDYKSEAIIFGTSYWDSGTSKWKGKITKLDIPEDDDLSTWTPPTPNALFTGSYPFTASPEAALDGDRQVWIYAGSGKYYSDWDEKDLSQQIFIGFRDTGSAVTEGDYHGTSVSDSTCPSSCPTTTPPQLCNVTACTTEGTVASTATMCTYDATQNRFENKTIVTSVANSDAELTSNVGWKIYLPSEERVISMPLAVGGLVDFLTYKPNNDLCAYGGRSYLYSVAYKSGMAPSSMAIRASGTTSGTSGDVQVYRGVELGPGAPPTGRAIIVPPMKEDQDFVRKKIQVATGVIIEAENKTIIDTASKIIHWLKK